jgi:hypothetical protein
MAKLSNETIKIVLDLQQQLLTIIDQATALGFIIFEQYGETETSLSDLQQLDNVKERADTYYSRFYTLLRRIAESQPLADTAMLNLLQQSIEQAQATVEALEATIKEIKGDLNIL